MESKLFDDLVESLKEAAEIAKGRKEASRRFLIPAPAFPPISRPKE